LEFVKWLVEEKKVDAEGKDYEGMTPLHIASQYGNLEVMRWYVEEKKVDVHVKNLYGMTPLHEAVRIGRVKAVDWLVKEAKADLTAVTSEGFTVLEYAVRLNMDLKTIKYIIEEINAERGWQSSRGEGVVHLAAMAGNLDLLKWLVEEKGVDIMSTTANSQTLLHCAVTPYTGATWSISGSTDIVKWLVEEKKFDISARDRDGYTPLHQAVRSRNVEAVKWLAENGSDLFALDRWEHTPTYYTEFNDHIWELLRPVVPYEHEEEEEVDQSSIE